MFNTALWGYIKHYARPRWLWEKRSKIWQLRKKVFPFIYYKGIEPFRSTAIRYNFLLTPNDRRLAQYQNKHTGQRCFIIGNGPSLKISDLDLLHQHNEITFAANKIFLAFDQTDWRPTYYAVEDLNFVKYYRSHLFQLARETTIFLPDYIDYLVPRIDAAIYYHMIWHIPKLKEFNFPNPPEFSANALKGIYSGCTITYILLQIAWYMGFREIYLLGVDLNYTIPPKSIKTNSGYYIATGSECNHFIKNYFQPGDSWSVPRLPMMHKAMEAAAAYAQSHEGQIYDLSLLGKLTAFPKVTLDSLF